MTHKDIYTKFMIEYDKAGASTSYPSLTEYEVATVLDKAYNALIAQKVTGNNYRRSSIESDIKSIADLGPLTKSKYLRLSSLDETDFAQNVSKAKSPQDMLYFIQASMRYEDHSLWTPFDNDKGKEGDEQLYKYNPVDGITLRSSLVKLVNHDIAQKFFASSSNIPWVKNPICFIEDRDIYVVYDPLNPPVKADEYVTLSVTDSSDTDGYEIKEYGVSGSVISALFRILGGEQKKSIWIQDLEGVIPQEILNGTHDVVRLGLSETDSDENMSWFKIDMRGTFRITYIRRPNMFVKDLPNDFPEGISSASYFDYNGDGDTKWNGGDAAETGNPTYAERYNFECNSTVAEELISLAVAFALENVESQRLNSKLNMRGLEA